MSDKRYLVFQCSCYYPAGGLDDLTGSFDTIEEAIQKIKEDKRDYNEIYDRVEGVPIPIETD